MEYQVIIKKRFAVSLGRILAFLEENWGEKVAEDFLNKVYRILDLLKDHPYIGAPSAKIPGIRGLHITSHNRLLYKIDGRKIIIVHLSDTRRKNY